MIKFKCPHCGKEVSAGDEIAGKKGRCPGCKEVFVVPAAKSAKPAPAAERRTVPPADDGDDLEVVEESKDRAGSKGSKAGKRQPDEDDYEVVEEAPRKKKAVRDDDDDEAISEAPRKKRLARDDDEEDEDRPRKKRGRDDDDGEDDEPRSRRKRDRDDDEDDDDRPRKKRKKRRGVYADCPNCGCRGDATMVSFTWWGGFLGSRLFTHVRCNRCGTCYNGKTGDYNTTKIAIYVGVSTAIGIAIFILAFIAEASK